MPARALVSLVALTGSLLLAACGSDAGSAGDDDRTHVTVTLTDDSCDPSTTTVPAGVVVFDVVNKGSGKISEAEVRSGDRILAEKENVVPGVSGSFTLDLKPGSYSVTCVGSTKTTPFTVTAGGASAAAADPRLKGLLDSAVAGYTTYVRDQVGRLRTATRTLTDAVRAGDLPAARAAYPAARVYYERIEPVAESFGDLDPRIDARADDVPLDRLTGFHRLEYLVFDRGSLDGAAPIADGLDADVARLGELVQTVSFQPAELANGASALLDEVGKTKITGEEERYSHVDLVDLTANVDGAQQAYTLLKPALQTEDQQLAATIDERFAALQQFLAQYRTGSGPADLRTYDAVTDDARKQLTRLVDALAEPLAEVAGVVVK